MEGLWAASLRSDVLPAPMGEASLWVTPAGPSLPLGLLSERPWLAFPIYHPFCPRLSP